MNGTQCHTNDMELFRRKYENFRNYTLNNPIFKVIFYQQYPVKKIKI